MIKKEDNIEALSVATRNIKNEYIFLVLYNEKKKTKIDSTKIQCLYHKIFRATKVESSISEHRIINVESSLSYERMKFVLFI